MALIKCPECGRDVSDQVSVCPHCGYPRGGVQPDQTQSSKKGGHGCLFLFSSIVVLGLAGSAGIFNSSKTGSPAAVPTTAKPIAEPRLTAAPRFTKEEYDEWLAETISGIAVREAIFPNDATSTSIWAQLSETKTRQGADATCAYILNSYQRRFERGIIVRVFSPTWTRDPESYQAKCGP